MTTPLGPTGVVALAVLERSGLTESIHFGAAVLIGPDERIIREYGNVLAEFYPRSTLKLVQAIGMLRAGADLVGEQLVLAAASHTGTPGHVRVVRGILDRAGLTDDDLRCPAAWPVDSSSRAAAESPLRITMGCSGKHAAMLLTCVRNGWPTASYLEPSHPLQLLMRDTVEDLTGDVIEHTGVDGCGTPVFAVTLRGMALAMSRIGRGAHDGATTLTDAIVADAWALDNPTIARVIDELGIVAKTGAEGVFVGAAPDGTAVAVKVIDGSSRALVPIALSLLAGVGAVDAEAAQLIVAETTERVLGGGRVVGQVRSIV